MAQQRDPHAGRLRNQAGFFFVRAIPGTHSNLHIIKYAFVATCRCFSIDLVTLRGQHVSVTPETVN